MQELSNIKSDLDNAITAGKEIKEKIKLLFDEADEEHWETIQNIHNGLSASLAALRDSNDSVDDLCRKYLGE